MNQNKDIDHIFKDGLANLSETPPAHVWDAIQAELQATQNNKKIIVFWRSIAAAAFFGLLLLGGLLYHHSTKKVFMAHENSLDTKITPIIKSMDNSVDSINLGNANTKTNITQKHNTATSSTSGHTPVILEEKQQIIASINNNADQTKRIVPSTAKVAPSVSMVDNHTSNSTAALSHSPVLPIRTSESMRLTDASAVDATQLFYVRNEQTIVRLFKQANNKQLLATSGFSESSEENTKKDLRFALGGQFSPSYSYRETQASTNNNTKAVNEDGIMSYTGGINLHIKTTKKWGIETGLYYARMGQKFSNPLYSRTENMLYSAASFDVGIRSKEPNLQNSMGSIKLKSTAQQELIQEASTSSAKIQANTNSEYVYSSNDLDIIKVQQELDYIEVPFLLRYNLLDKSVGLSISGGMSTHFLIGNNAYKLENSKKNKIGEMEDISNINYSAIFGFGLKTPLFKSLDFNFEPRVKYFINSVTEKGDSYKPYSFGIYTGISYTF